MNYDDFSRYQQEFLQEAKEFLDVFNRSFINLEKGDMDALNEIFRCAHTLKGMAGFMGYKNLETLCHRLENVLSEIRNGNVQPTGDVIDLMLTSVDYIDEILVKIEVDEDPDSVVVDDVIKKLESLIGSSPADKSEIKMNSTGEDYNLKLDITLSDDCVMKSIRAILILKKLNEIAKVVKTVPDESDLEDGNFEEKFSVYLNTDKNVDEIETILKAIGEIEKIEFHEVNRTPVTSRKPEDFRKGKLSSESIRVNVEQLDTIMNLVGELVISKNRFVDISRKYDIPELKEALSIMEKSITSLQDEIMRIRMVKIEKIFNKFPRMVRDLSKKLNKNIELIIVGQETELDRTIIDEINDPLVHLIRNAVDHGIESPEERVKAGKGETGRIKLSARREKNNIIIEIEDDGRGLDLEKIKRKALKNGLISQSEIDAMSEDEIKMLIFEPGFSTKKGVTELSGRGVGMDVVKTKVERLGGSVKIFSEKGKGTRVRIILPPTVAIVKSLLVKVSEDIYAIPISSVVKIMVVNENNLRNIQGTEILYVRGETIPTLRLRNVFKSGNGKSGEEEIGIIVEKEREKYALIVDSIVDMQEIVIKPLENFLAKTRGLGGVTILGNGMVVPILDVPTLVRYN